MEIKLDRDEIAKAILQYVEREITRTPMGKVAKIVSMYDLPYDIRVVYNDNTDPRSDVKELKETLTPEEDV